MKLEESFKTSGIHGASMYVEQLSVEQVCYITLHYSGAGVLHYITVEQVCYITLHYIT